MTLIHHAYVDAPLPLALAHRGGAPTGQENTTAAFSRAVTLGYRYIETDVRATADGVAVIIHDATLRRVFGHRGRISRLRWADVASLRCDGAVSVPRLDDVLDEWPEIRFNIDVKADNAVAATLTAIRRTKSVNRVLLASFSTARLTRIRRAMGPSMATSLGTREVMALWVGAHGGYRWKPPPGVVAAQVPWRYGGLTVVTPRFIKYCHEIGIHVHVWTINNEKDMHSLLELHVDGIISDSLELLMDVVSTRNTSTERQGSAEKDLRLR